MTVSELLRELAVLPTDGEMAVDRERFDAAQSAVIGIAFELGIPVFTTFDVRFQFVGRWVVLPRGDWDDHALSLKAAGWVQ